MEVLDIRKLKKLFEYRYWLGNNRKSGYAKTRTEAERRLNEAMYLMDTGQLLHDSPKFNDYSKVWLENHYALGKIKEKTRDRYYYCLKNARNI